MNPIVTDILGALVRYAIVWALGALLTHHVITEDQKQQALGFFTDPAVIACVVGAVITVILACRSVIRARLKLLTALASQQPTTEAAVTQLAKTDAPPLSTPKTEVPVSPSTAPNEP